MFRLLENAAAVQSGNEVTVIFEEEEDASLFFDCLFPYEEPESHPYTRLIKEFKKNMSMGKHTAANAATCQRLIKRLIDTGDEEAAEWAIWTLWWRLLDKDIINNLGKMYLEAKNEN